MKMPIKPGSLEAVTKVVNDTFTEQLKTFDQLYALDMFAASEEQIVEQSQARRGHAKGPKAGGLDEGAHRRQA